MGMRELYLLITQYTYELPETELRLDDLTNNWLLSWEKFLGERTTRRTATATFDVFIDRGEMQTK